MKRMFKHKNYGSVFLFLLILVIISACGSSRRSIGVEEGWELLGERKVNFVRDKDVIEVKNRSMFTAIRFTVERRDVRLNDLRIYFDNGDKLEPAMDEEIKANQNSRIIELARDGRYIDRIEFKYRTTGNMLKGRANVLIFGKKYNPYGY